MICIIYIIWEEMQANQIPFEVQLPDPDGKMDRLFYNAIKRKKQRYLMKTALQGFIVLLMVVFIVLDPLLVMDPNNIKTILLIYFGGGIIIGILNSLIFSLMFGIVFAENQENNIFFLRLATLLEHSVSSQIIYGNPSKLKNCVSETIYDSMSQTAIDNKQFFTKQKRRRFENYTGVMILEQIFRQHERLYCIVNIGKILTLIFVLAGAIVLIAIGDSLQPIQIAAVALFMVLSLLLILKILVFIFVCILFPLACFIFYLVVCCRSRSKVRKARRNMPGPQKATPELLRQADGQCVICFQHLKNEQSVIVLPCSKKHIFHEACIRKWAQFKPTCPICRRKLDQ